MYNAAPGAANAWRALFTRVFAEARLDVEIIEHRWPQPIDELWGREGLCGAFMCGWPFVRSSAGMQAVAAPVPAPARYEGLPRYCSEFLVRTGTGWTRLEDTFGHRFGWMAANSQSGFNAPRAHLASFVSSARPHLYSQVKGPLGAPAQALKALRDGDVDVVALDSFYLDLLRHHDPAALEGVRCVATTPWTPVPLLVAARDVPGAAVAGLRGHLLELHGQPAYAPLLAGACVSRFVAPDIDAYASLETMARQAAQKGYAQIR
ncbi:MAG TPA: PhnD/SsuA/transferrin family substrate-binding protein [Usitatibacter sp.]|jgi:ABC-type phosphate/phosphonate transport system substrate-binding protein|nr:PhnD/SsuA/transferrin family substrate-binding protein [Usitatibacter sp.]